MPKTSKKPSKRRQPVVRQRARQRHGSGTRRPGRPTSNGHTSTDASDVLAFAQSLRELAAEAEQLHGDAVEKRLTSITTKNLETRFRKRLRALADALHERQATYSALIDTHGTDGQSLCSRALRTLENEGFTDWLSTLTKAVDRVATHARKGLSQTNRDDLLYDIRIVTRLLGGLVEIADDIERRVSQIKSNRTPAEVRPATLPASVEAALLASEKAATAFLSTVARQPIVFEPNGNDSVLAWLRAVETERRRLMEAADAFANTLKKFTDEHLEKAKKAGHHAAQKLVADILRIVTNVQARRNVGQELIRSAIHSLQASLSLDDEALDAAGHLGPLLQELEQQFVEAGIVVQRQHQRAEAYGRRRSIPATKVPEWTALAAARHDGLQVLIAAFVRLFDEDPLGSVTKLRLKQELQSMQPRSEGWDSWLHRRLETAVKLGIVVRDAPDPNRTVAHTFSLPDVVVRKYATAARTM